MKGVSEDSFKKLVFHPAADVFPLLAGVEFDGLVESISRGYDPLHPILLHEGKILDGRNRYLAAQKAGVEPTFAAWESENDPWEFVWQENATRRHLPEGTKASCRVEMRIGSDEWIARKGEIDARANAGRSAAAKEQPRENDRFGSGRVSDDTQSVDEQDRNRMRTHEARESGISEATMGRALALYGRRPDLHRRVVKGEVSLNEALRLKRKDEVRENLAAFPDAKFRVLYADPPWSYGDKREEIGEGLNYGPATGHYPAMPMSALTALDVASITADNAVLFLWATSPLLPDGLEVMRAWGFSYKASFVWNKDRHNFGHYNSVRHEFLLVGTRGSCLPDADELEASVITLKRTSEHSQKPAEFRALIDRLYPKGKRIELFARGNLPKPWKSWGADLANEFEDADA